MMIKEGHSSTSWSSINSTLDRKDGGHGVAKWLEGSIVRVMHGASQCQLDAKTGLDGKRRPSVYMANMMCAEGIVPRCGCGACGTDRDGGNEAGRDERSV